MSKNKKPRDSFVMALAAQSISKVQKERSGLILVETEQGQTSVRRRQSPLSEVTAAVPM